MQYVVKRNGEQQIFDINKIISAINGAFIDVDGVLTDDANSIATHIAILIANIYDTLTVEQIQDHIEELLLTTKRRDVARAYINYRYMHNLKRDGNTTDDTLFEMLYGKNEYWNTENANKNARVVHTQRDYIAGITSTDITRRILLSKEIVNAHDKGIIHFHDADYYAQNVLTNCCLINLEDMLQNGTMINNVRIDKPHRLSTAMTIATQIITAVSSSQYGGCTISLSHIAPFVDASRQQHIKYYKQILGNEYNKEMLERLVHEAVKRDIKDAVQTFNYQVNSMTTTNGQAPFLSVAMYLNEIDDADIVTKQDLALLIEEFLHQRIQGFKNKAGVYVTQAFPKLLYFLQEDNIHEGDKYFYLTQLACKCVAKRMTPDFISEKIMKQLKKGSVYPCMGCRSFLTVDRTPSNLSKCMNYKQGNKYYGRFNQGVVTINLAYIGLEFAQIMNANTNSSDTVLQMFKEYLESYLELCHKALRARHDRLCKGISDMAPIMWQDGALARLDKHESIKNLLYDGYSTISLGYAGLYECCKALFDKSHTDPDVQKYALAIMQYMNDMCTKWKQDENIDYSLYGTPIESTTYKFAKCIKQRFGDDVFINLDGVDRNYITNSYHVPVFEHINPFEKLRLEAMFQALSPGGAISYVECCDLTHNPEAVLTVAKYIYDTIMYAELNTKSDYCQVCGYDGEIKIVDEDNKFYWKCPACGNTDTSKMNVARRTCGYIGTNFFNQGRTNEIRDRYVHIDNHETCK